MTRSALLAVSLSVLLSCCGTLQPVSFAQSQQKPQKAQAQPPQTVQEIERAIGALSGTVEQDQVDLILEGISGVKDMAERDRLDDLLHEQVGLRMQGESENSDAVAATPEAIPADEIEKRLEALPLGAEASAEQRKERDRLLSKMRSMPDGQRREEWLKQMEEREQRAGTLVTSKNSPASRQPPH